MNGMGVWKKRRRKERKRREEIKLDLFGED